METNTLRVLFCGGSAGAMAAVVVESLVPRYVELIPVVPVIEVCLVQKTVQDSTELAPGGLSLVAYT